MGWVQKSWAGAESEAGRVMVLLNILVARKWACEAHRWSSELQSPCIWELCGPIPSSTLGCRSPAI